MKIKTDVKLKAFKYRKDRSIPRRVVKEYVVTPDNLSKDEATVSHSKRVGGQYNEFYVLRKTKYDANTTNYYSVEIGKAPHVWEDKLSFNPLDVDVSLVTANIDPPPQEEDPPFYPPYEPDEYPPGWYNDHNLDRMVFRFGRHQITYAYPINDPEKHYSNIRPGTTWFMIHGQAVGIDEYDLYGYDLRYEDDGRPYLLFENDKFYGYTGDWIVGSL